MKSRPASLTGAASVLAALSLSGCLTAGPDPQDPYEDFNRQMFAFNDGLDRAVLEPVAHGYRAVTNEPIREGVGNFADNLNEPLTFVNHILQFQIPDAGATFGRFLVNTTVGIGGIFDPASTMGMQRTKEDFGQTLGKWGVQPGPYLVLPFLGSTNPRDLFGKGESKTLQGRLLNQLPGGALAEPVRAVSEALQRFDDPQRVYAYCFCTPSLGGR